MKGLGVPVHNQYGLRPATVQEPNSFNRWSSKATSMPAAGSKACRPSTSIRICRIRHHHGRCVGHSPAREAADRSLEAASVHGAGHREFNMFLWMPPKGDRAGDILFADSTIFTTLFGGDDSLERFWKNIATK